LFTGDVEGNHFRRGITAKPSGWGEQMILYPEDLSLPLVK
jgi:hypothetical protein